MTMDHKHPERFQNNWTAMVQGLQTCPDQYVLQWMYYEAVHAFAGIAEDIRHYDRMESEENHPDFFYSFLFQAVNSHFFA